MTPSLSPALRFGYRFEIPLLAQSVIMIVTMFALVELCVRTKNRNTIGSIKNRYFFGKSPSRCVYRQDFQ